MPIYKERTLLGAEVLQGACFVREWGGGGQDDQKTTGEAGRLYCFAAD